MTDPREARLKSAEASQSNGEPVKIVIDGGALAELTFGEYEILLTLREKGITPELITFLERIVVGGVRDLSLSLYAPIIDALNEAIGGAANPEDEKGKN